MSSGPGPDVLGRGVVVSAGQDAPAGFPDAPRVRVDAAVLREPTAVVQELHRSWATRERVVVELTVDQQELRSPPTLESEPYTLERSDPLARQRLHFLVWANNYDARSGEPVWWHGRLAELLGARSGGDADVVLPDGTCVWCDGGPREPLDLPVVHRESILLGRLTPARYAEPSDRLAPDQLAAVAHRRGAARIIAPAGSGKTRVLTSRLRHLLVDRGIEPELVTAVAYNNRAAAEMRERLPDLAANVRTLHSLGLAIVNAVEARRTLDEREVRDLLAGLVAVPRALNQDPMAPYLEALGEVRLGLRHPDEVQAERDDVPGFADAFPRYRQALAQQEALDFDEQIYRALELLLTRPALRERVQRSCTHLLVDEFQDLTPAFLLLVRLVATPSLQVFGVGDDDQVIYGHAGATPRYLMEYVQLFPGAETHPLTVNYRCPPRVTTAARTLLTHNRQRVEKVIDAAPGRADPQAPLEIVTVPPTELAVEVARRLQVWTGAGHRPASIAVLARVNAALLAVQVACVHAGIATSAPLDPSILRRTGVRGALAWLRIGLDPERISRRDLGETLRRPSRRVPRPVFDALMRRTHLSRRGLEDFAAHVGEQASARIEEYLEDLDLLCDAIAAGATTAQALAIVRDEIGLGEVAGLLDGSRGRLDGSSHADDLDALQQVAALHPQLASFEQWLVDSLQVRSTPDGVTLSSVHRVKGREWDRVIVHAANEGTMPHRLADDVEEERRVFHVALTRCRDQVVVVASAEAPSPFLAELDRPAPARPAAPARTGDRARAPRPGRGLPDATPAARPTTGGSIAAQPTTDTAQESLFEALRGWRLERARRDGVPPYVVMHDRHLREVAARRPNRERELAACPGIGPTKLERYGDEILAVIAAASGR